MWEGKCWSPRVGLSLLQRHCIFDRFFAIASSTAFSCNSSSSRRDEVLLRLVPAAAVSDGCIRAGLDRGWRGKARDALAGDRTVAAADTAVICGWLGRTPPRTGDTTVANFCVLSNFGIGIFNGSFSSVNTTAHIIDDDKFHVLCGEIWHNTVQHSGKYLVTKWALQIHSACKSKW